MLYRRQKQSHQDTVSTVAIEQDVLVIGGGLAGTTAAIAATRTGATTRLVSHKQSTMRHASGLIDVLGYTPEGEGPLTDPYTAVDELPEGHPYERAGAEAIEEGLSLFDDVTKSYTGGHTQKNALIPTYQGTIKPTSRYPTSMAPGVASDNRDTLLIGFKQLPAFNASLAAEHLSDAGVPFDVRGVNIEFPIELDPDSKVNRFTSLIDENKQVGRRSLRSALAGHVAQHLEDEDRIGFPAVLGQEHPAHVRADLEDELSADIFEVPMGPPSIPGIRLEKQMYDALDEEGVLIETGNAVVDHEAGNGEVESVIVDRSGSEVPYAADEYILATGGLVGKGIDSDREGVMEPIFDCHISYPENRYDWFENDAFGDHPFAGFGVDPDQELRPRDANEDTEFDNLRAVGSVLGNYDFAAEKSASGVSLATGYRAGTLAGENV